VEACIFEVADVRYSFDIEVLVLCFVTTAVPLQVDACEELQAEQPDLVPLCRSPLTFL
jgi:hypothetical protein